MEAGLWMMKARVHYRKLLLFHNILHSDDRRTIKRMLLFQKEYERRNGTWYSEIQRIIKMYNITLDVGDTLKSAWKKHIKSKISAVNKEEVILCCKNGVKTWFISSNEWGRQKYLDNGSVEEVKQILKTRLCMVNLPCNQRRKEETSGCSMCGEKRKIRMEHYFVCSRLAHLRRIMNIHHAPEEYINGSIDYMLKASRYLQTVARLVV